MIVKITVQCCCILGDHGELGFLASQNHLKTASVYLQNSLAELVKHNQPKNTFRTTLKSFQQISMEFKYSTN